MNEFAVSEVSRKLGLISEVMADGYHFVTMREHVEQWQQQADSGDANAQKMIDAIDLFHRLCFYVKEKQ